MAHSPTVHRRRRATGGADTTLTIVCAWCSRPMGEKPGHGVVGVSHTICPACLPGVLKQFGDLKRAPWQRRNGTSAV